jgi:small subunit ribosomal protein S2
MASVDVDIKQLLEAGAHFGHKTSRWHPKMARYIHSKRNGGHIIDLTKTVEGLDEALNFLEKTTAEGKKVLFVATKRQAQSIVKEAAVASKQPFVTERWLGGMLTNWNTISGRIKVVKDLEAKMDSGELNNKYNKLEVQRFQEQIDHMNGLYGGIKEMPAKPGAIFIVDITHDDNAVKEAKKLGIPIVALVDTNADPTDIDYVIPCNDDAIKAIQLVVGYVQTAVEHGAAKAKTGDKDENNDERAK